MFSKNLLMSSGGGSELIKRFVAVPYSSPYKVIYSTDGINWQEGTLSTSGSTYSSVCYGNGKFVAVITLSVGITKAIYSTDGINWQQSTLPISKNWQSVTYGNGKFVAVAYYSDKAIYSTDGINWTLSDLPSSKDWQSVTYGNGKFVAVTSSNYDISAYSSDGINWTESTLPSSASWYSVCYGNGNFVAVASGSDKSAYSTNGTSWTASTLPSSASWHSVCYGNGKFVAVAYYSDKVIYSTDGINWQESTLPSSASCNSVTYGSWKILIVKLTIKAIKHGVDVTNQAQFYLTSGDKISTTNSIKVGQGSPVNYSITYDSKTYTGTIIADETKTEEINLAIPFVQPKLSANGTLGGSSFAVSGSSTYSTNNDYYKAFDQSSTTYWRPNTASNSYLITYNPTAINITSFTINNTSSSYYARSVVISGSNDNSTYTNIGTITLSKSTATYNVTNTNHYKYYKFTFTPYSTSRMYIYELTLNGTLQE